MGRSSYTGDPSRIQTKFEGLPPLEPRYSVYQDQCKCSFRRIGSPEQAATTSSSKGKTPETIAISIVDLLGDEDPLLPSRSPSPDPPPPPRKPSPPRDDENRSPPRSDTPRPSDPNPDQPPSSTSPTPPPTSPDQSTSKVPDPTSATSVPSEPSTSRRKGTHIRKKTKRFTSGQSELGALLTLGARGPGNR